MAMIVSHGKIGYLFDGRLDQKAVMELGERYGYPISSVYPEENGSKTVVESEVGRPMPGEFHDLLIKTAFFGALREDVQKYFIGQRLRPGSSYRIQNQLERDRTYLRHRDAISCICGWGAPEGKYDQVMYDNAIRFMCDVFGFDRTI